MVALAVALAVAAHVPGGAGATTPAADPAGWTVYHGDLTGSGSSADVTGVDTSAAAWTSPSLDGQLFGEPLVTSGLVYVATEHDTVYALSSTTGAVVWSRHLGTPVPSSALPCGNISPTVGITGTPVIDPDRHELFVVADEQVDGHPTHVLVGLDTRSGAVELTQPVDPPGSSPAALLQRTGLTLDAGRVVFGMGGNYGDCASYRGRVGSVPETGGTPAFFTVDAAPGDSQGAVWMGGAAPAVDAGGNIWVGVGNGSVHSAAQPYDDSDSVLELSSSLRLVQFFAPASWAQDNARDLDLSMAPALLADGRVVIAGKSRLVYLLDGRHLGGVGGETARATSSCADDTDGGGAVVGTTVYLPCLSGIIAVSATASPPGLETRWSSRNGGGPPIVAAGRVWTIGRDGTLDGLDPATGKVVQQTHVGTPANHFPTPSVGDGLLLAASATRVIAFHATPAAGSATTATTTAAATGSTAAPTTTVTRSSTASRGLGPVAIVALVVAGLVVVGGGLLVWRRRHPG